ncbi:MAG: diacylglycerol kinase family protein [Bacteroidales bacterium]|nr:diacylglycerol kinase family protein [Bacteroidales bacterium]MDT8431492.1 diacylglycerol kinase family protein [Bacteroidales bacterium]
MKLLIVINPVSGGQDKQSFLEETDALCSKYAIRHRIFETSGKNDRKKLKKEISNFKPHRVIAAGGDGTVLLVSIALMKSKIPMGIVPLGSANGMAEELNIDPDPLEALKDAIMSSWFTGMDLVEVNGKHYSVHIGDVGSNARIVEKYEKDPNRGIGTYAKYFLDELGQVSPFSVKIKTETDEIEKETLMVAICNARKYGTGVPLTLDGNPLDGKFEIVLIEDINFNSLVKIGLSKFDERFFKNRDSTIISTKKAEISFDKPRLLQLDGETIGKFRKLRVKVIKGAVKLITTGNNSYLQD